MTCKDCIHSGLCYKENDYKNFPDRCGSFISDKALKERPTGDRKCVTCKYCDGKIINKPCRTCSHAWADLYEEAEND